MKRIKRGLVLGVIASTLLLSACSGGKADLEAEIEFLQSQNDRLQEQLQGSVITEGSVESSLQIVEGSEIPEFVKIDGKINFPNKLQIPDSADDVNNSNVMVGSMFKFVPSNNWLMNMNGATLQFTHPSKIWGNLKAVTIDERIPEEEMKPIVQSFFTNFPSTNITYRKVFMDDRVVGMLAKADIEVDKRKHVVNVGFFTRGDYGILALFVFEDNESGVQQELIDLLLSSGTYGDVRVKLE